jgi:PadR family transcriptional regulator PadR
MGKSSFSTDLMRSSADLVILTLLADSPMYGYQILVTVEERGNGEFRLKHGTLYPLLYRLEREGWIEAQWQIPEQGRKRKVYSLTAEGRSVQKKRAIEWTRFTTSVNSILNEQKS